MVLASVPKACSTRTLTEGFVRPLRLAGSVRGLPVDRQGIYKLSERDAGSWDAAFQRPVAQPGRCFVRPIGRVRPLARPAIELHRLVVDRLAVMHRGIVDTIAPDRIAQGGHSRGDLAAVEADAVLIRPAPRPAFWHRLAGLSARSTGTSSIPMTALSSRVLWFQGAAHCCIEYLSAPRDMSLPRHMPFEPAK